jgi:hypothetical protein
METGQRMLALCTALPAAIVLVIFGASGAAALVLGQPIAWPPQNVTLPEAVALRDRGEPALQMMRGVDPNGRYLVRNVLRDNETVSLTPLEAAVITRESYMMGLVKDYGAVVDERNAAILQCLAKSVGAEGIRQELMARAGEAMCDRVELPWSPDFRRE